MRQVQRALTSFYASFSLIICTIKKALMLLLKGATYLETPKHDSVLQVQSLRGIPTRQASDSIAEPNVLVK